MLKGSSALFFHVKGGFKSFLVLETMGNTPGIENETPLAEVLQTWEKMSGTP